MNINDCFLDHAECTHCGAPFDFEVIQDPVWDEDGELVEPAELAWYPLCDCDQESPSKKIVSFCKTASLPGRL